MDIPSATEFEKNIVKNIQSTADQLESKLVSIISERISDAFKYSKGYTYWFDIIDPIDLKDEVNGIPSHILLYGTTNEYDTTKRNWTKRTILEEIKPSIFERIQKKFSEHGYTVFDISDISKSYSLVLRVYSHFPREDEDEYFNKAGKLWHNNDMLLESTPPPDKKLNINYVMD